MSLREMKFLDLIQSYTAQEASIANLYGNEGRRVGSRHRGRSYKPTPQYKMQLVEAARFIDGLRSGAIPQYRLEEAMSTSDFPNLFGDIIDRTTLGNYADTPAIWPTVAARRTVADFRTIKRLLVDGGQGVLAEVGERVEYPEDSITDGVYTYAVKKHGKRFPFSWEAMINDDLDMLKDVPERMGRGSKRSEDKFVTTLYANNTTFFTAAHKNIVSTAVYSDLSGVNPAFNINGVADMFTVFGRQLDTGGDPITILGVTLVVPPSLEVAAQNFMNATSIQLNERGGTTIGNQTATTAALTSGSRLIVENWMAKRIKLVVNPYLPIVDPTHGTTGYYMFATPTGDGRPAMEFAFLRGHESPEIFMKEPNARRVGGGAVNPMDGDFDTDAIHYKVRHVFGGATLDVKMGVYSNGSGS